MSDVNDAGGMFLGRATFGDQDAVCIGDDMRIGEEAVWPDHEAGPGAAPESAGVPGRSVVGDLGGDLDSDHGLVDIVGGLGGRGDILRQRERVKERGAAEQQESIHGGKLGGNERDESY